jgi:hypothetical protein
MLLMSTTTTTSTSTKADFRKRAHTCCAAEYGCACASDGVRLDGGAVAAAMAAASPSSCEMASLGRSAGAAGRGTAGGPSALRSNGCGSCEFWLGSFTCAIIHAKQSFTAGKQHHRLGPPEGMRVPLFLTLQNRKGPRKCLEPWRVTLIPCDEKNT